MTNLSSSSIQNEDKSNLDNSCAFEQFSEKEQEAGITSIIEDSVDTNHSKDLLNKSSIQNEEDLSLEECNANITDIVDKGVQINDVDFKSTDVASTQTDCYNLLISQGERDQLTQYSTPEGHDAVAQLCEIVVDNPLALPSEVILLVDNSIRWLMHKVSEHYRFINSWRKRMEEEEDPTELEKLLNLFLSQCRTVSILEPFTSGFEDIESDLCSDKL